MIDHLHAYIPEDRRHALARGVDLPDRAHGAVMFADVTGFTPLAEALAQSLGPRRGAEELTALLNQVYTALIAEVHCFGGSVIGFSGDAITCWFDDADHRSAEPHTSLSDLVDQQSPVAGRRSSSERAVACALAMRQAMAPFAAVPTLAGTTVSLTVKIAIAAGPVRRFLIGDPQIQVLEVLAGRTLDRLAASAHLAEHDDVLVDAETLTQLNAPVVVAAWREDAHTGSRAAVITELLHGVPCAPWPMLASDRLPAAQIRSWLLPAVYTRLRHSPDPFLAELRPAVAVMVQFGGLDYDRDDDAGVKLDTYIRQVQAILTHYEGILTDVTMADKGGYLFAAFGAPIAHEDDAQRALHTALELQSLRVSSGGEAVRIGISRGTMRTGPYGSATRRTYGVLGDEVNLACRLMSHAAPGEVLVSDRCQQTLAEAFQWQALPAIRVKGKRAPTAVYRLLAEAPAPPTTLRRATTATEIIGRAAERAILADSLVALMDGTSGVVVIDGEAGIGKSRLIAELAQMLQQRGIAELIGSGQSIQLLSYGAWRDIFMSYFGLENVSDLAERQARVRAHVAETAHDLIERLPLLNEVLNLRLPDTDLTRSLDAVQRGEHLADLLVELLHDRASNQPLVLVLEDAHWLDSRSWSLAIRVAQGFMSADEPLSGVTPAMLLVVALRPVDTAHPSVGQLTQLLRMPGARRISLGALSPDDIVALVASRLGVAPADLPEEIAELARARAGGNPLFAEELITMLCDQGLIRSEVEAEDDLAHRRRCVVTDDLRQASQALPDTLLGLILGRIDRLPREEQLTLKVAAVIGPTFEYRPLHHTRNQQATIDDPALKNQLRTLAAQDFIWLEAPEPNLAYSFKHVLTQQAAYQSLLYAQRRELHRIIAGWYEHTFADKQTSRQADKQTDAAMGSLSPDLPGSLSPYIPLLAYHYRQAEDAERERYYVALLGEQMFNAGAFEEATACFERALALMPHEQGARGRMTAQLARASLYLGERDKAEQLYQESLALVEAAGDQLATAHVYFELGSLAFHRATHPKARDYLERSLALYHMAQDRAGQGRALDRLGGIYIELGEEAKALDCYQQAITLGRHSGSRRKRDR
jgi:class 3 adenylate cyclase/predicted ATPase